MIPIKLHEWENEALQPYIERYAGVIGLGKLSAGSLVDKINALPDGTPEKALLVHYWQRLRLALSQQNDQAIAGWLTALALATHAAGFLVPKAAGKLKQEKTAKRIQPAGTAANKVKGDEHLAELHQNILDYITGNPSALNKSAPVCRNSLRAKGLLCGYKDSTALGEIKKLFAEKRKQHMENTKA